MSSTTPTYVAVVDDDESLCRSLDRLLRASGIQPIIYSSAEEFLAETKRPKFDCLVFDIQLGGISGIELQRQLVAEGGKTPVIFITAHDDPEARTEAEAAGCAARNSARHVESVRAPRHQQASPPPGLRFVPRPAAVHSWSLR